MTDSTQNNDTLRTPEFRMSFPNLFTPRPPKDGKGEPKYGVAMLFPKPDTLTGKKREEYDAFVKRAKAAAEAAAKAKWGDKVPKNLKSPFLDAGNYETEGYEAGMLLLRTSSKQKPGVVDANVQPIMDASEIYPGCWGRATIRAFAYDVDGGRGVAFGLQNVQKTRDGEPLAGRRKAEDEFEAVSDEGGSAGGAADADSLFG